MSDLSLGSKVMRIIQSMPAWQRAPTAVRSRIIAAVIIRLLQENTKDTNATNVVLGLQPEQALPKNPSIGANTLDNKENDHMWNQMVKDYEQFLANRKKAAQQSKALDKQVGGNHYKHFQIQPAEFCHRNSIPYLEATAIKYLCRWRHKGGFADLDKAIHFIEILKELECSNSAKKA